MNGRLKIFLGDYQDDGHVQPLHAKLFIFETPRHYFIAYGSADFTSAALMATAKSRNVETLLLYSLVPKKSVNPRALCDPDMSAVLLTKEEDLQTSKEDRTIGSPAVVDITITEAFLDDRSIAISTETRAPYDLTTVKLALEFPSVQNAELPLRACGGRLVGEVPDKLLAKLSDTMCVVFLRDRVKGHQVSNKILLINLLDIDTNNSIRRERHIREAQQSAQQFFTVLNDLIRAGDEAALLAFLNFCDIPLINVPRPPFLRGRPVWEGREGMRSLGVRNLQICKNLHEAALNFFDRHLRKLQRHSEARALEGVANFLHIFLSMGGLLRAQIERTVVALEEMPGVMTVDQWAECRTFWDIYFRRFKDLMTCLWDEYLEPMSSEYDAKEIKEAFTPDLDALHELIDEMLNYRMRIEKARKEKCITVGHYGQKVELQYFQCLLGETSWAHFKNNVADKIRHVDITVVGRMQKSAVTTQG